MKFVLFLYQNAQQAQALGGQRQFLNNFGFKEPDAVSITTSGVQSRKKVNNLHLESTERASPSINTLNAEHMAN